MLNLRFIFSLLVLLVSLTTLGQVAINTTNQEGTLDVTSINNTGLVLRKVSAIENVTDGNGNRLFNVATVHDISRTTTYFYQNNQWIGICKETSNTENNNYFDYSLTLSSVRTPVKKVVIT